MQQLAGPKKKDPGKTPGSLHQRHHRFQLRRFVQYRREFPPRRLPQQHELLTTSYQLSV